MRTLGTRIGMTTAAVSAAACLGVLGCGAQAEEVSTTTANEVRASIAQIEGISKSGCRLVTGDTGLMLQNATSTLVTAAAHHPGATVGGLPMSQLIMAAAAPARRCGYTDQAKRISLAALGAAAKTN